MALREGATPLSHLYHRLPERIEAHVLLCWLALLLVRLVETEAGRSWELLRDELDAIHRVNLRTKDRALQVVSTPSDEQRKLLKTLDIPPPKRVQSIVSLRQACVSSGGACG